MHLTQEGDTHYNADFGAVAYDNFGAFAAAANAGSYDAVIAIGDLAHEEARVSDAGDVLDTITGSVYAAMGNHEILQPAGTYAQSKALSRTEYGMPGNYYAANVGFCRVIVLDANYGESDEDVYTHTGRLPAAELAWLENELDTHTQDAVVIFIHHPPRQYRADDTTENFDADDLTALQALLDAHDNVFVYSGHWHAAYTGAIGNTPYVVFSALVLGKYYELRIQKLRDGSIVDSRTEKTI